MLSAITSATLIGLVGAATWTDLRYRRVPNALTVGGLCAGLLLRSLDGFPAVSAGVTGAVVALLLTLPLFLAGGMGGGDSKLLVAVGAFLGPQRLLVAVLVAALVGGVMALGLAARRRILLPALASTAVLARHHFAPGRSGSIATLASVGVPGIPYAVAIAVGALAGRFL